ncbi:hypothetical protein ACHAXT_011768 [Thalassiosira profunda]
MPPSTVVPSLPAHFHPGRRCPALTSRAPTTTLALLLLLFCSSCPMDAEAAIANVNPPAVEYGSIGKPSGVRSDGGKGRRRMDDTPDESPDNAQRQMRTFFDNLLKLQYHYGTDVITVQDATEMYPILGQTYEASRGDCPFAYIPWRPDDWEGGTPNHRKLDDRPRPCFTPIITIHDRIANSFNSELPDALLLSGLDSREEMDLLGPSSILEAIRLLLECARCESLSPWVNRDDPGEKGIADFLADEEEDDEILGEDDTFAGDGSAAKPQRTNAIQCRRDMAAQQIDDSVRKWLARLVATRRIANVAGFYQRLAQLDDGQTDQQSVEQSARGPEYDFPIPLHVCLEPNACMSTFPARLMNELVRSHAFQLGLAFHGTNEDTPCIEIPSWKPEGHTATFDRGAMEGLARACLDFGFPLDKEAYVVRIASAFVEDGLRMPAFSHFAYAAGRVTEGAGVDTAGSLLMDQCQCGAQDVCAYPSDRTGIYDGSSLRAFVAKNVAMREVPSSIDELPGFDPSYDPFGFDRSRQSLFERNRLGANVRMSLLATELVQPWTAVRSIAGVELKDDDIVPLSPRVPGGCTNTRRMKLPESSLMSNVTVTWTVGGALSIAETAIMHGKWGVLDSKIFDCVSQPYRCILMRKTKQELDTFFSIVRDFEVMDGETTAEMQDDVSFTPVQSGATRWHSSANDGADSPLSPETTFSASIDISDYKEGARIAIVSLARADQGWVSGESPNAQTHVVNARTNPDWSVKNGGSLVKGRLDWFSVPVTIEIGPQPGFFEGRKPVDVSVRASDEGFAPVDGPLGTIAYALLMAVVVVASTLFCVFCREKRDGTDVFSIWGEHRRIDKQKKISMDEFFSDTELTMIGMS